MGCSIKILFVLLILISLNSIVSANMTEISPTDIGNTLLGFLMEWFWVIVKIAIVLGVIYYIIGFGDPDSKASGTRLIKTIIIAVIVYYTMPWLISQISNI